MPACIPGTEEGLNRGCAVSGTRCYRSDQGSSIYFALFRSVSKSELPELTLPFVILFGAIIPYSE